MKITKYEAKEMPTGYNWMVCATDGHSYIVVAEQLSSYRARDIAEALNELIEEA